MPLLLVRSVKKTVIYNKVQGVSRDVTLQKMLRTSSTQLGE